jgi:hypothetical protein
VSRHAAARRTALPLPLSVTLAVTAAAVLLGSITGTFAFWSDDGTVASGSLRSGTLDLTFDGNLAGAGANGGTWTNTAFALDTMLPGESVAASFVLRNAGTAGLTYAVSGSATGALAPGLRFSVYAGGAAANAGTAAAGNRAGTCGGAALATDATLGGSASVVVASRRALAAGASETVCLVARLDSSAANSLQGTTAAATLVFDGRQVGG